MHQSDNYDEDHESNEDQSGAACADNHSLSWDALKSTKRPTTVIMDNEVEDEEDDYFLVQEKLESDRDAALERMRQAPYIPPEHRGLLVDMILDTQRELENVTFHTDDLQVELAERDKEAMREVYLKQMNELKGAIQQLSKCANPLANIAQRSQDDACLMEIEYRKLRVENDRLQRRIDEAKAETSRVLYPLTEALTHLDSSIEKMEGAIVLAKQRLEIMDEEYEADYIVPITDTDDRDRQDDGVIEAEKKLLKEFAQSEEKQVPKSLKDVFQRGIFMTGHGHFGQGKPHGITLRTNPPPKPGRRERERHFPKSMEGAAPKPVSRRTSSYEPAIVVTSGRRQLQQPVLSERGGVVRTSVMDDKGLDQDIKPPWWD